MSMAATVSGRAVLGLEILLVEDQPEILASVRDALGRRGHRVTAACDGQQAIDRLLARRFDVAICDVRIPRPDGVELVRRLRRELPESELIVMSPSGAPAEPPFGIDERALHHMPRPFDLERLIALVGRMAEQRLMTGPRGERRGERMTNTNLSNTIGANMNNTMSNTMGSNTNHTPAGMGGALGMAGASMPMGTATMGTGPMAAGPIKAGTVHGSLEPLVDALKQFERGYLLKALHQCDWQRTRTADMLGISRKTLWQKLKQHRISESEVA